MANQRMPCQASGRHELADLQPADSNVVSVGFNPPQNNMTQSIHVNTNNIYYSNIGWICP